MPFCAVPELSNNMAQPFFEMHSPRPPPNRQNTIHTTLIEELIRSRNTRWGRIRSDQYQLARLPKWKRTIHVFLTAGYWLRQSRAQESRGYPARRSSLHLRGDQTSRSSSSGMFRVSWPTKYHDARIRVAISSIRSSGTIPFANVFCEIFTEIRCAGTQSDVTRHQVEPGHRTNSLNAARTSQSSRILGNRVRP